MSSPLAIPLVRFIIARVAGPCEQSHATRLFPSCFLLIISSLDDFRTGRVSIHLCRALNRLKERASYRNCKVAALSDTGGTDTQSSSMISQPGLTERAVLATQDTTSEAVIEDSRHGDSPRPILFYHHTQHIPVLPNELLYKIIHTVICNAVHTLCVSSEDTIWERGVIETLHHVSPAFKAISTELASKAFDLSRSVREDDARLLQSMREILTYLDHLGTRLRHPQDWGSISFQTIDCTASSFVFAYALYLSCITLRRNAFRTPLDAFESTHKVVLSGLTQSEALCKRVTPQSMTERLRKCIEQELSLAQNGLILVDSFQKLNFNASAMRTLNSDNGALAAIRYRMHLDLEKVEGVYKDYAALLTIKTELDMEGSKVYDLPGVLHALRNLSTLVVIGEDEYNIQERIDSLIDIGKNDCPFLNPCSTTTGTELSDQL